MDAREPFTPVLSEGGTVDERSGRCGIVGCQNKGSTRGLCHAHYMQVRRADRRTQRRSNPVHDYSEVVHAIEYRVALSAAHARITQALMKFDFPDTNFSATLYELLRDAEMVIRNVLVKPSEADDYEIREIVNSRVYTRGSDVY